MVRVWVCFDQSINGYCGNLDETTKIFPAKDHRENNNINTVPSDIRLVHKERRQIESNEFAHLYS
jgi:hypothetical protein